MKSAALAGLVCAVLLAAAGGARAGWSLQYTSASTTGLIAIEALPPKNALHEGRYQLEIAGYAPASHELDNRIVIPVEPPEGWGLDHRYVVFRAPAGVYAIRDLRLPRGQACFNGGTMAFEVRPGQVTYLGRYEPDSDIAQFDQAWTRGQVRPALASDDAATLFDAPRPSLRTPAQVESWRARLASFLAVHYPGVSAPIEAAEPTPAVFGVSAGLFGQQRVCHGHQANTVATTGATVR